MTYRRSGSLWSLLRALLTARVASRRRRQDRPGGVWRMARRALRRWLRR
jgi:hypothetical protein